MEKGRNSIANALELRLPCTNPSMCMLYLQMAMRKARDKNARPNDTNRMHSDEAKRIQTLKERRDEDLKVNDEYILNTGIKWSPLSTPFELYFINAWTA